LTTTVLYETLQVPSVHERGVRMLDFAASSAAGCWVNDCALSPALLCAGWPPPPPPPASLHTASPAREEEEGGAVEGGGGGGGGGGADGDSTPALSYEQELQLLHGTPDGTDPAVYRRPPTAHALASEWGVAVAAHPYTEELVLGGAAGGLLGLGPRYQGCL